MGIGGRRGDKLQKDSTNKLIINLICRVLFQENSPQTIKQQLIETNQVNTIIQGRLLENAKLFDSLRIHFDLDGIESNPSWLCFQQRNVHEITLTESPQQ